MDALQTHLRLISCIPLLLIAGATCSTPDYVGSRDCAELVRELDVPWFAEMCESCQGKACDLGECNESFPCVEGKIVIEGCEEDSDCADMDALCASNIAMPHHVCTVADAS